MRIALITDIHGNLAALEAVTSDLRRRGVDAVVNLGDSLSGPLQPLETAQYLMAEGWISLAGNHERQILVGDPSRRGPADEFAHSRLTAKEFSWLESLPSTVRLSPEIFLCHGTPSSDVQYFLETIDGGFVRAANSGEIESRVGSERSALIACGHTHIPRVVRARHGQVIVNPGSVGLQAYADAHPSPHFMETGSPDARYAIVEKVHGGWSSSLLSVPYDHRSMANIAKLHGSSRWEHALLTGYCLGDG
jgi:predicted phosphodiesterase